MIINFRIIENYQIYKIMTLKTIVYISNPLHSLLIRLFSKDILYISEKGFKIFKIIIVVYKM